MSYWQVMRYKRRIVIIIILVILPLVFYFRNLLYRIDAEREGEPKEERPLLSENRDQSMNDDHFQKPRLAIIVPFRDRFDELIVFLPLISDFLRSQAINNFNIYILNQSSKYRFNRGALANVGYLLTKNQSDYIAIHDVDLIPMNKNLSYSYPELGPYHLSAPEYHPQYNYNKYFGGILLVNNNQFELVNGMSNRYFGWGLEDDEFYTRIKAAKLPILRPEKLTTNRSNTFLHIHSNRKRDTFKTNEQREVLRRRDRHTGLNDIKYSLTAKHSLTVDEKYHCTVFNVELFCDTRQTPWCLRSYAQAQLSSTTPSKEMTRTSQ